MSTPARRSGVFPLFMSAGQRKPVSVIQEGSSQEGQTTQAVEQGKI